MDDTVVVTDLLARAAALTPGRDFAFFHDGSKWSFADAARQSWIMANHLARLGVRKGDRVMAWLPNGPAALRTWFGANALGAAYVPLNPAHRGALLDHALNTSGAHVIVAHESLVNRLASCHASELRHVLLAEGSHRVVDVNLGDQMSLVYEEDLESDESRPNGVTIEGSDTLALVFTSGTTGDSKAVQCSYLHHANYCEGLFPTQTSEDRWLVTVPLFHVAGTTAVYSALARGASVAILDGFKTASFFDDVRRLGATHATMVGAMARYLLNEPEHQSDRDHPLRTLLIVPMVDEPKEFADRFGVELYTAYGSTEATCPIRSDVGSSVPGSCGRSWSSDFEIRIVDESDVDVPTGDVGELVLRHHQPWSLTDGYYAMPEATAQLWRNGWLHTGDALRIDVDGNYYFVDRAKDTIRRRGENISSVEVEREINAHPAVAESAVVGARAVEGEDEIRAFITLIEGEQLQPEVIVEWLIPRLANFMVPRYIDFVDILPRTDSQKVRKQLLRDRPLNESWDRDAAGIRPQSDRIVDSR